MHGFLGRGGAQTVLFKTMATVMVIGANVNLNALQTRRINKKRDKKWMAKRGRAEKLGSDWRESPNGANWLRKLVAYHQLQFSILNDRDSELPLSCDTGGVGDGRSEEIGFCTWAAT